MVLRCKKFDVSIKRGCTTLRVSTAIEAMQRWACIYHAEGALAELDHEGCHRARQQMSKALWNEFFEMWSRLHRTQVSDGSKIAQAID